MLIGGNMSTGRRTRLTVPTTAITRHTMMKYGLRMENPDMLLGLLWTHPNTRTQPGGFSDHHQVARAEAAQDFAPFRSFQAEPRFLLHELVLPVYDQKSRLIFRASHRLN